MSFKEYILTLLGGLTLGFFIFVPLVVKYGYSVINENTIVLKIESTSDKSKCKFYFNDSQDYILLDCSRYKVGDKILDIIK